jgi:hypothetical protein
MKQAGERLWSGCGWDGAVGGDQGCGCIHTARMPGCCGCDPCHASTAAATVGILDQTASPQLTRMLDPLVQAAAQWPAARLLLAYLTQQAHVLLLRSTLCTGLQAAQYSHAGVSASNCKFPMKGDAMGSSPALKAGPPACCCRGASVCSLPLVYGCCCSGTIAPTHPVSAVSSTHTL